VPCSTCPRPFRRAGGTEHSGEHTCPTPENTPIVQLDSHPPGGVARPLAEVRWASDAYGSSPIVVNRTGIVLDPHPLTLDAVVRVLEALSFNVLAKTSAPTEALEAVLRQAVSILILDIEAQDAELDGLSCLAEVTTEAPETRSIVLTAQTDSRLIDAVFDAGAEAYVVKTVQPEDLAAVIRQAFEHSVYLPSLRRFEPGPLGSERSEEPAMPQLTRRELEILRLVAQGHSNGELAKMLWVTEQTVKFHLSNTYRKLGVANRTEAGHWAHTQGLLDGAVAPRAVNGRSPGGLQ
jgi:DNA-binding NarL/FixJ family response regulator